jgi:hypothetical protein
MGIHRKSGRNTKKNLAEAPDLERLAGMKKSGIAKSGIWNTFALKKVKKRENRITAVTHWQPAKISQRNQYVSVPTSDPYGR